MAPRIAVGIGLTTALSLLSARRNSYYLDPSVTPIAEYKRPLLNLRIFEVRQRLVFVLRVNVM